MRSKFVVAVAIFSVAVSLGCRGKGRDVGLTRALDVQECTEVRTDIADVLVSYVENGPFLSVTATADRESAPVVPVNTALTVTLPAVAQTRGMYGGSVRFQAASTGLFAIGVSESTLPLGVTFDDCDEIPLKCFAGLDCTLTRMYLVELEASGSYTIDFGPSTVGPTFTLVVVNADDLPR